MERPYFEETQYLRQTRWIWFIIIPSCFVSLIPFLFWSYDQQSMSQSGNSELLITSLLTIVGFGLVMIILLSVKLDTRIDHEGIHYRYFPNKPKWNCIRKEDIASVEVKKKKNFFTHGISGYHRNIFQKTQAMTIQGNDHLWVCLKNDHKILLGTQNPTELERAMKRLLTTEVNF